MNERQRLLKVIKKAKTYGITTLDQLETFIKVADAGHDISRSQLAGSDDSQSSEVKRVEGHLRKMGPGYKRSDGSDAEGLDLVKIEPDAIPVKGLRGTYALSAVRLTPRGKRLDAQIKNLSADRSRQQLKMRKAAIICKNIQTT